MSKTDKVCEPNIGARGIRQRVVMGVVLGLLAVSLLFLVIKNSSPIWVRLTLWPLYFSVALSFFQAREKTCVVFGMRGVQQLEEGLVKIADANKLLQIRKQMQHVGVKSMVASVLVTIATLFF